MKTAPAVAKLMAFLADIYPSLDVTPTRVAAWSSVLGHYSEADLRRAALIVARTHRHGAPSPALFVEALEGDIESVLEPNLEYGLLSENGRPLLQRTLYRVFPDGTRRLIAGDAREGLPQAPDGEAEPVRIDGIISSLLPAPTPHEAALAKADSPDAFRAAWARIREFFGEAKYAPGIVNGIRVWVMSLGEDAEAVVADMIAAARNTENPHADFIRAAGAAGACGAHLRDN